MRKNRIRVLCLLLASTLLFTGCHPLSKEETTVDSWENTLAEWKTLSPQDIEEHITIDVSDTYRIDADISISGTLDSYEVNTIKLTRHIYDDVEARLEEWIAYSGIQDTTEIVVSEKDDMLENGEKMQLARTDFGTNSDAFAQVRSVYAIMSTPFSRNYGTWRLQNTYDRQAMGRIHHEFMALPSEKELITETEILAIKENLETIFGVEFLEEYDLYTCTLERLQELVEWEQNYMEAVGLDATPDERWEVTEADEGTVLCFKQGYEDIPFLHLSPSMNETGASWAVHNYCQVISSKEGIEGLELLNPYDIVGENETVKIMSFAELIEKHVMERQGVDTTVVDVGLYYLPIYTGEGLDFIAKPVWYIQMEIGGGTEYASRDSVLYDAVTGEEIPW